MESVNEYINQAVRRLEVDGIIPDMDELCPGESQEVKKQVSDGFKLHVEKNPSLKCIFDSIQRENGEVDEAPGHDVVDIPKVSSSTAEVSKELPTFKGYTTKELLGSGSYGVVYKAMSVKDNKFFAIKMLNRELCRNEKARQSFIDEAHAMVAAKHPNVVEIYDIVQDESETSTPYIVMEYLPDGTLRDLLRRNKKLDPPRAAEVVSKLAGAVHNMHCQPRSVIHRDLKPENTVLSRDNPKITDFGIARRTDHTMTSTPRLGTPAYMAPEQIGEEEKNAAVGPKTDLWALGVILYECLTGKQPFTGNNIHDTYHRISKRELVWSSEDIKTIPNDLRAICIKCLEKNLKHRYGSVSDLETELQRFALNRPVKARLPYWYEWPIRYARNQPKIVIGLVLGLMMVMVGFSTWAYVEKSRADKATIQAGKDRDLALEKEREARLAEESTALALIGRSNGLGEAHAKLAEWDQAAVMFAHAATGTKEGNPDRVRDFRRAQSHLERTLFPVRAIRVSDLRQFAFSPSGQYLSVVTKKGELILWDIEDEIKLDIFSLPQKCTCATWETIQDRLAVSDTHGQVRIIDIPLGKTVSTIQSQPAITKMRYSPTGKLLAIGGNSLEIWSLAEQPHRVYIQEVKPSIRRIIFSPREDYLAVTATRQEHFGTGYIFNLKDSKSEPVTFAAELWKVWEDEMVCNDADVFFALEGSVVVSCFNGQVVWRDTITGQIIPSPAQPKHDVTRVVSCPLDRFILTSNVNGLQFWDARSRQTGSGILSISNYAIGCAFSPDGDYLVSCTDREAQFWTTDRSQKLSTVLSIEQIRQVLFAPDGRHVAIADSSGLLRLFRVPIPPTRVGKSRATSSNGFATMINNGTIIVGGTNFGDGNRTQPEILVPMEGVYASVSIPAQGNIRATALSSDGKLAVIAEAKPHQIRLWDTAQQKDITVLPLDGDTEPLSVAFIPNKMQVAVVAANGLVLVLDYESRKQIHQYSIQHPDPHHHMYSGPKTRIDFSPDHKLVAVWGLDAKLRIFRVEKFELLHEIDAKGFIHDASFSPQGTIILATTLGRNDIQKDGSLVVWNVQSGKEIFDRKHPAWVFRGRFSKDGTKILTACRDGFARIWDLKATDSILPQMMTAVSHREMFDAVWVNNEQAVISAGEAYDNPKGIVQLWDSASGVALAPSTRLPAEGLQLIRCSDDEDSVYVGGRFAGLYRINTTLQEPWVRDAKYPELAAQVRFRSFELVKLTNEEWFDVWKSYRATTTMALPYSLRPTARSKFHSEQASSALARQYWSIAEWHLTQLKTSSAHRTNPHFWAEIGEVHARLNHWAEALGCFQAARKLTTDDYTKLMYSAYTALAALRTGNTNQYLTLCKEIANANAKLLLRVGNLREAALILAAGPNVPAVLESFSSILAAKVEEKPDNCFFMHLHAGLLIRAGDHDRGSELLNQAFKIHGNSGEFTDEIFRLLLSKQLGVTNVVKDRIVRLQNIIQAPSLTWPNGANRVRPLDWVELAVAMQIIEECKK